MSDFYSALGAYVTEFYPDSVIAEMIVTTGTPSDEDLDHFVEQMDSLIMTFEAIKGLTDLFGDVQIESPVLAKPNCKLGGPTNKDAVIDPLEAFLNKNVRK